MNAIKRWFAPPVFEGDEAKTRHAGLINMIGLTCIAFVVVVMLGSLFDSSTPTSTLIIDLLGCAAILQFMHWLRSGWVTIVRVGIVLFGLAYVTAVTASIGTIRTPTAAIFVFWVLLTGLLFELRGILIGTAAASMAVWGLILAENAGWLRQPNYGVGVTQWITFTALFGFTSGLTFYIIQSTKKALTTAEKEIEQRKQIEAALLDSEQRYRTLVEWTLDPIAVHRDGKTLYANPAAVRMFGADSESDLVGKSLLDRVHPEYRHVALARVRNVVELGLQSPVYEQKLLKLDGTAIDVEVQGMVISYGGKPAVQIVMHDITGRKQAQEKLRQSEERLQLALRGSGDAYWDWNLPDNVLYYSPRWWEMIGYGVDELQSDAELWRRLVHPDDLSRTNQVFASALESDVEEYQIEFRLLHKDGHYVPVLSRGFILRDSAGKPVRVAGTNSDWTERKAIEATLKDSERRYRTLVEWTPEPIVVHRETKVLYVNRATVEMFGAQSATDLVGSSILDWVHPDYREIVVERWANFAKHGLNSPMMVQKLLKLDGALMDVEVQGTTIIYDGEPAFHVSMRDITERKAIEAALEVARVRAENASRAKSRFLTSASHDLRQPAHALGLFVARLAELPNDAQTRHLVDNIDASVRAMQELLDGFLDIARLDAEHSQVSKVAFPIDRVFGPLRESFAGAASDKGLRLRFRSSSAWVESDPNLLQRILLNLVGNAVRYTRQGSILVACRPLSDGTHLRIEVRDSGIGIAQEHHEEIFQEFFQVDNPHRDRSQGLGVGLSIVERACGLLNHPLSMRSAPGRGTRFTLTVPLAPAQAGGEHQDAVVGVAKVEFDGLRVLLIEDDELGRVSLASLLTSWGCRVTTAEGANAACALYRQGQSPDVTISDFRLRGAIDGIQAVDLLSAIAGRRIVACLISGDTDANVRQQAQAAGLTLLQKPVRPAKLRSLVRHLVQGRSAH